MSTKDVSFDHVLEPKVLQGASGEENPPLARCVTVEGPSEGTFDRELLAPLSFAQQRLWFLEQLHPQLAVYNMPVGIRLEGTLHVLALQRALAAVIERHEVLRTRFISTEGEPWQEVVAMPPWQLPLQDLSVLPSEQRERELERQLEGEARRPFNLSTELLLRAILYRLSDQEHVLFLNLHHIVADAASYDLFFQEISRLYAACVAGLAPGLPDLPIQYADYAAWQRKELTPQTLEKSLAYWQEHLAGAPELLELPADRPRPTTPSFRGGRRFRRLPLHLAADLQTLVQRQKVTLFMLLLAAFKVLLARLSHQEDLSVGIPFGGRQQVETEGLIGPFINTLVLRSQCAGNPSFCDLLRQVRRVLLQAYEHQQVPFEKLIERLRPERSTSYAPLFQVMFLMQSGSNSYLALPGLKAGVFPVLTGTSKFDLTLTMTQLDGGLTADMEYNSDLFDEPTVDRWLEHWEVLLQGIVADPEQRLQDLPLLSEAQRQWLLVELNNTKSEYPRERCVHELFAAQAHATPEAIALSYGTDSLSYRELNARANQLARYLQKTGVQPGVRVAICAERSPELIVGLLGILKAGGAYAALDLASPKRRLAQVLEDLQAPVLLTQWALLSRLPQELLQPTAKPAPLLICLDSIPSSLSSSDEERTGARVAHLSDWSAIARESAQDFECKLSPESLAYVSFTSGSTGRPKGVCVPHRAVVRLVRNTNYAEFSPQEVFLQFAPIAFDASTFEVWGALLNGAHLVLAPPQMPSLAELSDTIKKHQVSTAWFTTGLFNQLVEEQPEALQPLRQILTGGDVLSPPHIQKALALLPHCRLINGYGPTENTTFSTTYPIPASFDGTRAVPIGQPIANSECYVLDAQLQPVPIGVAGELCVGGDGLALGYLNRPEWTAEKFIAHPFRSGARLYRTGDLARYLADGKLEFLGRKDLQVKIRGFRVEPGEVEAQLLLHPAVRQCAVSVRADAAGQKQLVAYIVSSRTGSSAPEQLQSFLREHLPEYMVPTVFVPLEALPLSPNGKVDRRALPLPAPGPARAEVYAAPRDQLERDLQQLWEKVLEVRPVGIGDNFFALGGHSLLAVRLLARLEKTFGKRLPVAALFQNPTIERLAALLQGRSERHRASAIVEIQPQGSRCPLFLVHGAGGGMFWGYSNLSRHLGPDQPIFAFHSRGLEGQEEFESIEAMAQAYLADLLAFQPHGPYYLGGYCFGGVVAYELARLLQAQGHQVGLLALINSNPPNSSYTRFCWTPGSALKFARNLGLRAGYAVRTPPDQIWEFLRWKGRLLAKRMFGRRMLGFQAGSADEVLPEAAVFAGFDLAELPDAQPKVWQTHLRALRSYKPQPYPGRVTLFRSPVHLLQCSFAREYGWAELALDGVDVRTIPCAHEKIMEEPHVRLLAAELKTFLAAGD